MILPGVVPGRLGTIARYWPLTVGLLTTGMRWKLTMHPFVQQPSKRVGWFGRCEHGHWTSKARHSNPQCQTRGFVNLTAEVALQDTLTGLFVHAGRR